MFNHPYSVYAFDILILYAYLHYILDYATLQLLTNISRKKRKEISSVQMSKEKRRESERERERAVEGGGPCTLSSTHLKGLKI